MNGLPPSSTRSTGGRQGVARYLSVQARQPLHPSFAGLTTESHAYIWNKTDKNGSVKSIACRQRELKRRGGRWYGSR